MSIYIFSSSVSVLIITVYCSAVQCSAKLSEGDMVLKQFYASAPDLALVTLHSVVSLSQEKIWKIKLCILVH